MTDELTTWGATHVLELVGTAPGMVRELVIDARWSGRQELVAAAEGAVVAWRLAARQELVNLGGPKARQVVALLRPYPYLDLEALLAGCGGPGFLVAVDSVTDPGNLGGIIRAALFFGAQGVIIPARNSVGITPAVVRRSAGAAMRTRVARVTNLARALRRVREAGFWTYGSVVGEGLALGREEFPDRACFVLGREDRGLRPLVARHCDVLVTLSGAFESLNVASFAAVLFYEWSRKTP